MQSAPIAQLRLTHFMGLMTYTKDQWTAFFTQEYPAPGKLPAQFGEFTAAYDVLNRAYQTDEYSQDTERLKRADEDCDHTYMGVKKMVQAQQAFDFNQPVKAGRRRDDGLHRQVRHLRERGLPGREQQAAERSSISMKRFITCAICVVTSASPSMRA